MDDWPANFFQERPSTDRVTTARRTSDREELLSLLAAYRPYLRSIANQSLSGGLEQRVDGSDLVQEALLRGTAGLNDFRGTTDAELAAWLKQILDNLLKEWLRFHTAAKRDHRKEVAAVESLVAVDPSPSSQVRQREDLVRLNAAIQRLSPDQQQVIALRNQDLSFEDIGRQFGRSTDAARMMWARAIARLGTLMKSDG